MSGALLEVAALALSLALLVAGGKLGGVLDAPLVGEITTGLVLGPHGVDLLPHPDAVVMVGQLGLCLLVMEGGLSVDLESLSRVGPLACLIAVSGTLLPICLGCGFMTAAGYDATAGVAAGTALSSTSIGMATKMMQSVGELNTPLGSLICVAAMVDDVLSLVILAVVGNVRGGGGVSTRETAVKIASPVLVSVAVVVAGAAAAHGVHRILGGPRRRVRLGEDGTVAAMLAVTTAATVGAGAAGSTFLLGAFVGGLAFARVDGAADAWGRHADISSWLTSVFFLSVGAQVPLSALFSPVGVALGVGYTVPAVAGKLVTGAFLGPEWGKAAVVGWAMVGRGELGFVMAQEARDEGLMGERPYAACVWALLAATLASPVFMRRALDATKRGARNDAAHRAAETGKDGDGLVGGEEGGGGAEAVKGEAVKGDAEVRV